ncbi:hypothetical protein [Sphingobium yanoikuyae]|uniref:hypothetical protein n=1 Tax=Sphingobium yanoikuyae TaxID=13690 RepID=UPI0013775763|nr:hypothetical protein [Sphingobium yanoikuyae]NBB41602.1 hypothetical protein [Sphingobium yanoikuyae]
MSELDIALSDQQSLVREFPHSFAVKLSGESLRSMELALRRELAEVLRHRQAEHVSIALDGPSFANHSAKLSDLGVIFTRVQKLFSSVAQAITTGPTNRGPIPAEIMSNTALRLQTTFASSFGMDIAVPSAYDLLGESLPSETFTQLFQLLNSASDEARLMRLSGEVGRRSLVHLRHLATHLRATDATLKMGWKDFAGTRYEWSIETAGAEKIIASIDNITETRSDTSQREGWLVGASLLRNRFEILLDDGQVIEGKFVAGLSESVADAFGKRVVAVVDETEVLDRATGEARTFYTLKEAREIVTAKE